MGLIGRLVRHRRPHPHPARRRRRVGRHPPGRQAGASCRRGRPALCRRASSTSGCRPRRGRPRPPRRRRSTAWPTASSRRSASSRVSRAVQQRFVSDVSHELRTPLTTIRMAVDLIHESRAGLRAHGGPVGRAARRRARPVRGPARRPARDQPVRRGRGRPRRRAGRPARHRSPRSSRRPGRSPSAAGSAVTVHAPDEPAEAEVDERRVERILRNLARQRHRARRGRPVDMHVAVGRRRRRGRRRGPRRRPAPG